MKLTTPLLTFCLMGGVLGAVAQNSPPQEFKTVERALPEAFRNSLAPASPREIPVAIQRLSSRDAKAIVLDTIFEDDFADGLDDWTVVVSGTEVTDTLWTYSTADSTGGPVRHLGFDGPTKENGYASLDFSAYIAGAVDQPTDEEGGVNQDLVSPVFSTANYAGQSLSISFYQLYRYFNDEQTARISFSTDGGQSFSPPMLISPRLATGRVSNGRVSIHIPDALVGFEQTQIRFSYTGGFYSLAIDDIVVGQQAPVQVGLDTSRYAIAPNVITPETQVDSIYPAVGFYNKGSEAQDVELRFELVDTSLAIISSVSVSVGSVDANTDSLDVIFPRAIAMPSTPGQYVGIYRIESPNLEEDVELSDDALAFTFIVEENRFAKNFGANTAIAPGDFDGEYVTGNIYYTPALSTASVTIDSIYFAAVTEGFEDNGSGSAIAETTVWGYRGDLNADGIPSFSTTSPEGEAELVELGSNAVDVDSTFAQARFISVTANEVTEDTDNGSVVLPADQGYIGFAVTVAYTPSNSTTADNDVFFLGYSEDYNYTISDAANFALFEQGRTGLRPSHLLTLGREGADFAGYVSLEPAASPFITAFVNRNGVDVGIAELASSEFGVSPNPANATLSVTYDFGATQAETKIRIFNSVGQVVYSKLERGLSAGRLGVSTASLPEGVYYLNVGTSGQQRANRAFMVAH